MARNYKDIKLKDLIHKFMKPKEEWAHKDREGDLNSYPWDRLKKSIKENGLLKSIRVREAFLMGCDKYKVVDGNHRIKVLRELYGDDYIQTCVIVKVSDKAVRNVELKPAIVSKAKAIDPKIAIQHPDINFDF